MASSRSTNMPRFWAFRVSGRLRRMRTIRPPSNSSYVTYLYSGMSVSPPHPSPASLLRHGIPRSHQGGHPAAGRPSAPVSVDDAEGHLGARPHGQLDLGS